jgi:hypothetical protein
MSVAPASSQYREPSLVLAGVWWFGALALGSFVPLDDMFPFSLHGPQFGRLIFLVALQHRGCSRQAGSFARVLKKLLQVKFLEWKLTIESL